MVKEVLQKYSVEGSQVNVFNQYILLNIMEREIDQKKIPCFVDMGFLGQEET